MLGHGWSVSRAFGSLDILRGAFGIKVSAALPTVIGICAFRSFRQSEIVGGDDMFVLFEDDLRNAADLLNRVADHSRLFT